MNYCYERIDNMLQIRVSFQLSKNIAINVFIFVILRRKECNHCKFRFRVIPVEIDLMERLLLWFYENCKSRPQNQCPYWPVYGNQIMFYSGKFAYKKKNFSSHKNIDEKISLRSANIGSVFCSLQSLCNLHHHLEVYCSLHHHVHHCSNQIRSWPMLNSLSFNALFENYSFHCMSIISGRALWETIVLNNVLKTQTYIALWV